MRGVPLAITVSAALVVLAGAAKAHITAMPDTTTVGSHFIAHFTVPHGCSGSPTVAVRFTLPPGLSEVKPEYKPGWKLTVTRDESPGPGKLGAPTAIEWRGGPLPDSEFETFGILMQLPNQPGTLYFPTVQQCVKGTNKWINIPAAGQQWHDVKEPAPFVRVIADGPPKP